MDTSKTEQYKHIYDCVMHENSQIMSTKIRQINSFCIFREQCYDKMVNTRDLSDLHGAPPPPPMMSGNITVYVIYNIKFKIIYICHGTSYLCTIFKFLIFLH